LRQVASQLAGLLVLAAAGGKTATPDHPMLIAAEDLYRSAADGVRCASASVRAQAHHHHLLRAMELLGAAISRARTEFTVDATLRPLREAFSELQHVSRELPGFQIVSFEHGCCASGVSV
jgi:hypothetical protein